MKYTVSAPTTATVTHPSSGVAKIFTPTAMVANPTTTHWARETWDPKTVRLTTTIAIGRSKNPNEESSPYPFLGAHKNSQAARLIVVANTTNTTGIHHRRVMWRKNSPIEVRTCGRTNSGAYSTGRRSEEHTSELQSRGHLVCRLLLEKKKQQKKKLTKQ